MGVLENTGAGDGARTRYLHLGKVALYQMSYARGTMGILTNLAEIVKPFFTFFFCLLPQTSPQP